VCDYTADELRRVDTAAHRAGTPVKAWTVNGAADMRRLLAIGDALITDRPDVARSVLAERSKVNR
jgi:glycerophosphoryl diester phosphodiesterase